MRRWDNIIQAPMTQYERFYRMVRILNDLNADYRGDLMIPDGTGLIHINKNADNGRDTTGYSRSIIAVTNDPHQYRNRINEEMQKEHNDIRLAELAMQTHFSRLSENERLIMISKYFPLKGREKLPKVDLSERQYFRVQRYAEFHLIVEWGLNIFDTSGMLRGYALEHENDAFFFEHKISTNKKELGEPRRIRR